MRHFTRFTALFLAAALLLSGCSLSSERTEENSTPKSSSPVSEAFDPLAVGLLGHTDSDSPLGTQPLGEDVPLTEALYLPDGLEGEMLRVCVYDSARQGYTLTRYPAAGNETAGQLAQAALDALYPQGEGIALNGIRVERGFAVVDLALTPDSPAAQALTDEEAVTALLNSLACTLRENGLYSVGFTLDGAGFSLGGATLEDDGWGSYEPEPLYNQPLTREDFARLRALLPWPGLKTGSQPPLAAGEQAMETAPEFYTLLWLAGDQGAYADPSELDPGMVLRTAIQATPDTYACRNEPERWPLYPQDDDFLRPLSDAVQDSEFIPGEWVEATARAIWGEEVPVVHEDASNWTWHETEGVYTPPHMGIGSEVLPYPHSITQTEDGWTAEVSYLLMNMGGVSGTTEEYQQEWIPLYEDLDSDSRVLALLDTLPRWTVTARYDADGVLHLVSCQPAE